MRWCILTSIQVSELAEEQEIRDLFERFGRVTRVFLARDRETQRAKGFAFISFADRSDAARACDKMDGCMLLFLLLLILLNRVADLFQLVIVTLSFASSLQRDLLSFTASFTGWCRDLFMMRFPLYLWSDMWLLKYPTYCLLRNGRALQSVSKLVASETG